VKGALHSTMKVYLLVVKRLLNNMLIFLCLSFFIFLPTIITILFPLIVSPFYWIITGNWFFNFQFDEFLLRIQIVWIAVILIFFAVNLIAYYHKGKK